MSPYWSPEEEKRLIDHLGSGAPLEEVAGVLHRSVDAVILKAKRLGYDIPEKCLSSRKDLKVTKSGTTTTTSMKELPDLQPAQELISLEEMMKTMLGAMKQLQNPSGLSQLEIKRFRSIVSGARTYMHMLERFGQWTHIEQGLVNMTAKHLELNRQRLQLTKNPAEKAEIEKEIKSQELWLQQSAKNYKPFEKKPSLIAPSQEE
jgi:hypothetical protein